MDKVNITTPPPPHTNPTLIISQLLIVPPPPRSSLSKLNLLIPESMKNSYLQQGLPPWRHPTGPSTRGICPSYNRICNQVYFFNKLYNKLETKPWAHQPTVSNVNILLPILNKLSKHFQILSAISR